MGAPKFIDLLLPAAAFALVAFADMIATVRTFAQKHGYEVGANAELRALGAANMTAGLTSSFPISSSNSRSAVNDSTGAKTQASVIVASIVVGAFLFALPLIEPLPKAALGVIIIVAAIGLIDVRSIWRLRHVRDAEVVLAVVAFTGVLLFGVVGGISVAIAASIGVFLYRFDAAPFFVNSEYLRQRVLTKQLEQDLTARDVVLVIARLKGRERQIFEETGLTGQIGADRFFPTVGAAVQAFERRLGRSPSA